MFMIRQIKAVNESSFYVTHSGSPIKLFVMHIFAFYTQLYM